MVENFLAAGDAVDALFEAAVRYAVIVDDATKPRIAALLADCAHMLGPTARRVIAGHIVEHDSDDCWKPALRALSKRGYART